MSELFSHEIYKSFLKEIISKSPSIFKELEEEARYFLNIGLLKYLEYQIVRYSKLKTLLHGVNQVNLYDVYFPLKLKRKNKLFDTDSISKLFKDCSCITISGDAGSGKSTLVKHLFLNCIQEYYAIPIMLELRYLNETNGQIDDYIKTKIFNNKITESERIYERMLRNGNFIFFLDGFDEITSSIKEKAINSMNMFIERNHQNKFLLTTRPYTNIEMLPQFESYQVKPLSNRNDEKEIDSFIKKQLGENDELASKIIQSIEGEVNEFIKSFLSNPLLLSLYILTFQNSSEIPNKKYIFYRRVINALFLEHDSKSKVGYTREKHSNLGLDQFEKILKAFCFISFFEDKYSFNIDYVHKLLNNIKQKNKELEFQNDLFIYDLKLAVALWVEDGGIISFAHRSLQEYFTARFIHALEEEHKKIVYEKIIKKCQLKKSYNETHHFLSLCEEMDTIPFYKYYSLPLLYEIKKLLNFKNDQELVLSFLKFFYNFFEIRQNQFMGRINSNIHKSIYMHYNYTFKLYKYIEISAQKDIDIKKGELIILKNWNPSRNIMLLNDPKLIKLVKEFGNFVKESITNFENYINESTQRDLEMIELIWNTHLTS